MTKLERAIDALYRGRCNLIEACKFGGVDQDKMKGLLLDKIKRSSASPIQLSITFTYS
jgi:hypothetical protein